MKADLRATLDAFDGVHTNTLEKIAATLPCEPCILSDLCDLTLSGESKLQSASTWLLKRFSERGVTFNNEQTRMLLDVLAAEKLLGSEVAHSTDAGQTYDPGESCPATVDEIA